VSETKELVHPDVGFGLLEARQRFERLFLFRLKGKTFIFRPLTISECESIFSLADYVDSFVVDDWIVTKTAISGDVNWLLNEAMAGYTASVASYIIKKSTLKDVEEIAILLDKERESKSAISCVLDSMVMLAAGHIVKDSKSLTYRQQIKYVAFAEDVLSKKLELAKPSSLPENKKNRKLSPEAARILSKEAADKPNFEKDNEALRNV